MPFPSKSRGASRSPSESSSRSRSRPRSRTPGPSEESLGNSPADTREEGEADESDLVVGAAGGDGDGREPSPPPLPEGPPPEDDGDDDGWQPLWDETYQAYYFFNAYTGETTWTNPRVPTADLEQAPGVGVGDDNNGISGAEGEAGGGGVGVAADSNDNKLQYNPAIHGDYDPTAPYAQVHDVQGQETEYTSRAAFNRFTGKFQPAGTRKVPENYNDENKSKRQMEFYFDVDAAASSHDGRSLKAERQTRKLTRKEVKQFQEKRKARKEEKRKAWLRD